MCLFIAIILIAELIIAGSIIYWLIKFDKKAKAFTTQWIATEKDSINLIKEFRGILKSAQKIMDKAVDFVVKKKRDIKRKLISLTIIYAMLVVFKLKFKRAALVLQYALLARDLWKNIPI